MKNRFGRIQVGPLSGNGIADFRTPGGSFFLAIQSQHGSGSLDEPLLQTTHLASMAWTMRQQAPPGNIGQAAGLAVFVTSSQQTFSVQKSMHIPAPIALLKSDAMSKRQNPNLARVNQVTVLCTLFHDSMVP